MTLAVKGGYLDFSHLTELKTIYINEIYIEKQYKSSIIKNHNIAKIKFFDGEKSPQTGIKLTTTRSGV